MWKTKLKNLETNKQWAKAIDYMQEVIASHPDDVDAYIFMNYLIMNLLVEEDYDEAKHDYYAALAKKYFDESYAKFSEDPEYLYYTGITAVMSEWYFGIDAKDYEAMITKAQLLDPENPVYAFHHYWNLYKQDHKSTTAKAYASMVLSPNSPVKTILDTKGACGRYLLEMRKVGCKEILGIRYT